MTECGVMPREKINTPKIRSTGTLFVGAGSAGSTEGTGVPVQSEDMVPTDDVVVQVGWHKDAWVQVSIEADVRYFKFAAEVPDAEAPTSDCQRSTVYSPPLERDELNTLIRVLRRARDQAFGRDE